MALIKCDACGQMVSDKAEKCPQCGAPIAQLIARQQREQTKEEIYLTAVRHIDKGRYEAARHCVDSLLASEPENDRYNELLSRIEQAQAERQQRQALQQERQKRVLKRFVIGVVLLAVILGGLIYYLTAQSASEQRLWEQVQYSHKPAELEDFLQKCPNGSHKTDAEERLAYVNEEIALWTRIKNLGNAEELAAFIQKYPEGPYHDLAVDSYDDLLWSKACQTNALEDYNFYLAQCPQGKHYAEAKKQAEYQEKVQITEEEASRVNTTLGYFFGAVARNDETYALSYVTPKLDTFLGKTNATKVDVLNYMSRVHADGIYNVEFSVADVEVKKTLGEDDTPQYVASFALDQRYNSDESYDRTFISYVGTAVLNPEGTITALTLKKVSQKDYSDGL